MSTDPFIGFATKELRFERLLGKGAMGAVYQGLQLSLQRKVAIKVIGAHLLENPAYIARFEREAQTVGRLIHPNIIACHDFGLATGPVGEQMYLMILEFVDGWSLGTLAATKRLSVRQVLELHRQAAEGLAAAHRVGIVHRDIKPDNIMVTKLGEAKLADFGLARQISQDSDLTAVGTILGSPAFMSPEACRGKEPNAQSDLYSLGCSLLQTLTGATTFAGSSPLEVMQEHINAPVPSIGRRRAEFAPLQSLIDRALAKAAKDRFRDGHEFAQALANAAATTPRDWFAGAAVAKPGVKATTSMPLQTEVALGGQSSLDATIATSQDLGHKRLMNILYSVAGTAMLLILVAILYSSLHGKATPPAPMLITAAQSPSGPAAAPSSAPAAAPAAPVATDPPMAPDPADVAVLDKAAGLISAGQLDDAQNLLDNLVVSGALKQRKGLLQNKLADAWIGRQGDLESQLNSAANLIATAPQSALTQLSAMQVPDRFSVLEQRQAALMKQAQAALAAASAATQSAPTPAPAGVASPAAALTPAKPATAFGLPLAQSDRDVDLISDDQFTFFGNVSPVLGLGSPLIPPLLPYGTLHVHASVLPPPRGGQRHEMVPIALAPFRTTAHDGLLLLVHMLRPGPLYLVRRVDGVQHVLLSVQMSAQGWETVSVDLGAPVNHEFQFFAVTNSVDGVDIPFVIAAAARGNGVMPTYANLKISPGTLLGNPQLDELLLSAHLANRVFPRYDRLHLTLPLVPFHNDPLLLSGIVAEVYAGFLGLSRHRDPDVRGNIDFSINNRIPLLPLANVLLNHRADFYLQLFSTAAPPPASVGALGEPFQRAVHQGVLPVLILSADDCSSQDLHEKWQTYGKLLRQEIPGLPILDLAQVPLSYALMNQPIDLGSAQGRTLVGQGLEAGLRELRARSDAYFNLP